VKRRLIALAVLAAAALLVAVGYVAWLVDALPH
jgi:hypothetical protein